jgi:hypothetical protein
MRTSNLHCVRYAGGLVLLAGKAAVLRGVIDGLVEIGGRCEMEMNVEKTEVMRL